MAAPTYIKYGTTQYTDIRQSGFGNSSSMVNYVYYRDGDYKYCCYKRPDPTTKIEGTIKVNNGKNSTANISNRSLTITGSYKYPDVLQRNLNNWLPIEETTVSGTYSHYITSNVLYLTLQRDYYNYENGNTTPFSYIVYGTINTGAPYYEISKTTLPSNVTINSVNYSGNDYQYTGGSINFTWQPAAWTSSYNTWSFTNGSKQGRDIKIDPSAFEAATLHFKLAETYGTTRLDTTVTSTKTYTCVHTDLIPSFYISWSSSSIGSTVYLEYTTFVWRPSMSDIIGDHTYYTETSTGTNGSLSLGTGTSDLNLTFAYAVARTYSYEYLTFTHVSGDEYTITNNDKISHTVYYNSKKCNSGDAKNWTGLSDVKTSNVAAGKSSTVYISSNWFADSQTCSFTTRTYRYISYRQDSYSSSTYSKNRISI